MGFMHRSLRIMSLGAVASLAGFGLASTASADVIADYALHGQHQQ